MRRNASVDMVNRLAVGIGFILVFALITWLVVSQASQAFDAWWALAINGAYLGRAATAFLVMATEYGREYFWIPVVAIMLIFGKRDMKVLAVELALLFIIGIVAGEAMKYVMFRPRPFDTLSGIVPRIPLPSDSSYPSGHALIVSIGAVFAVTAFTKSRKGRAVAGLLALEAAIVIYSRVYVGVHYPLDVISGFVLACAIVFIGTYFLRRHAKRVVSALAGFSESVLRRLHAPGVL